MNTRSRRSRPAIAALLLLCLGATHGAPGAVAAASSEYMIKAAYLLNFARLVQWPHEAFATQDSPITIGIIGTDPFGEALNLTVIGKRINNRQVVVKRLQWTQEIRQCQILFVSADESSRIRELSARVDGLPVLVVGDTTDLARHGATISFRIQDDRVRFDVNVEAARSARLTISSQVLRMARIVKGP